MKHPFYLLFFLIIFVIVSLNFAQESTAEPTAPILTPLPTATAIHIPPTLTPSLTFTSAPSPTFLPTMTATLAPSPTLSPTLTATAILSETPIIEPTVEITPEAGWTETPSPEISLTATGTVEVTATATPSVTLTLTMTETSTATLTKIPPTPGTFNYNFPPQSFDLQAEQNASPDSCISSFHETYAIVAPPTQAGTPALDLYEAVIEANQAQNLYTIYLCAGVFPLDKTIVLLNNINIFGRGMDVSIIEQIAEPALMGGLITINGFSHEFRNLSFKNGIAQTIADTGGAILMWQGQIKIYDSKLDNNLAMTGGAIGAGAGTIEIYNSIFVHNAATSGGAIKSESVNPLALSGDCVRFEDNESIGIGGAIHSVYGSLTNSSFINNSNQNGTARQIYAINSFDAQYNYWVIPPTFPEEVSLNVNVANPLVTDPTINFEIGTTPCGMNPPVPLPIDQCTGASTNALLSPTCLPVPSPTPGTSPIRDVPIPAQAFHSRANRYGLPLPFDILPYVDRPELEKLSVFGYGPNTFAYLDNISNNPKYKATYGLHTGVDYGSDKGCKINDISKWCQEQIVSLCDGVLIRGRSKETVFEGNFGGSSAQPGLGISVRCFDNSLTGGSPMGSSFNPIDYDTDRDGRANLSNIVITYNHLIERFENYSLPLVDGTGLVIRKGQIIGKTGADNIDHLHMEVYLAQGYQSASNAIHINPFLMYSTDLLNQHNPYETHLIRSYYPIRLNFQENDYLALLASENSEFWKEITYEDSSNIKLGIFVGDINQWSHAGNHHRANPNGIFWNIQTPLPARNVEWHIDMISDNHNLGTNYHLVPTLDQKYPINSFYHHPNCDVIDAHTIKCPVEDMLN